MTPSDLEIAYSAGLLDGEGCVSLVLATRGGQPRLSVQVVNTDHEVLAWLQSRWGGAIYEMRGNSRHRDWARCWAWMLNSQEAKRAFLEATLPHLIVKRRAVEIALRFIQTGTARPGQRFSRAVSALRLQLFHEIRGITRSDYETPVDLNDDQLAMELAG